MEGCFIKKIFENKTDDGVHNHFVRFSRGFFPKRALLKFHKTDKIKLKGSFEYANDFAEIAAEIGGGIVSGFILSKEDISNIMSMNNVKGNSERKKGGLFYQNNIEQQELSSEQLKALLKKSYFALIDITNNSINLKIKKKLPKPGKSGDGKVDDKFCQLEADLRFWNIVKDFFFWDVPECNKASISHDYIIESLILPKNEKDFEKIRILTKRKGKIIRRIEFNKQEKVDEKEIEV